MAYTVKNLAKISGVTVRTLHYYDEIGLLKPAYIGENGYRFYEEEELLSLQQILFLRELGIELKKIQKIIGLKDFSKVIALRSHKKVLQKDLERIQKLLVTIDKTIDHIQGEKKMKDFEMYKGFDKEAQAKYEKQIVERFGEEGRKALESSKKNTKGWSPMKWTETNSKVTQINQEIAALMKKKRSANSSDVQKLIQKHYDWVKQFWTPNKKSYVQLGEMYSEDQYQAAYKDLPNGFVPFIQEAMAHFAETKLD